MWQQSGHHAAYDHKASPHEIGETLPLFAGVEETTVEPKQAPQSSIGSGSDASRQGNPTSILAMQDRHMQAAWQLSKALKAAKNGHKSGRKIAKLTPGQRHQVGNAICEHLLASLRQQVDAEKNLQ